MKMKLLTAAASLIMSSMALATWFPGEEPATTPEANDCRSRCSALYDADWLACDYLPVKPAVWSQCRKEVNAKIDACIVSCTNK